MVWILGALFVTGAVAASLVWVTARRGLVTSRSDGYEVPDHVRADPERRRQANRLVERWAGVAVGMCLVAVAATGYLGVTDQGDLVDTPVLVALAVWGFLAVVCASYPFERIKRW